jgi:hypothetical protein
VAVLAVQGIRRMRGGAQGHLMLASDGNFYVVKFRNNPQHMRVLANELIASKLAERVGLTVPQTDVVEVTEWLIANSPELRIEDRGRQERCAAGLNFGSRYVGGLMPGQTVDYLTEERLREVRNVAEFAGMLAIDKWTCNSNGRQAVFDKKPRERKYRATFVDQGFCFHAGEWTFPDAALRGVYARNAVYAGVTGWESFEPWLTKVEEMPAETLWSIAQGVPPEWYGGDTAVIERLMEQLMERRSRVRELITSFRVSGREPFPNWKRSSEKVKVRQFEELDEGQNQSRFLM